MICEDASRAVITWDLPGGGGWQAKVGPTRKTPTAALIVIIASDGRPRWLACLCVQIRGGLGRGRIGAPPPRCSALSRADEGPLPAALHFLPAAPGSRCASFGFSCAARERAADFFPPRAPAGFLLFYAERSRARGIMRHCVAVKKNWQRVGGPFYGAIIFNCAVFSRASRAQTALAAGLSCW